MVLGWVHAVIILHICSAHSTASHVGVLLPESAGNGQYGALGSGMAGADSNQPAQVMGTESFTEVCTGAMHSCALDSSGKAFCWGEAPLKPAMLVKPVTAGCQTNALPFEFLQEGAPEGR